MSLRAVVQKPGGSTASAGGHVMQFREPTRAFRERQQSGSGGAGSPRGVAAERVKPLAKSFNTGAAGLLTGGLTGPMAMYLLGFTTSARSNPEITEAVVIVYFFKQTLAFGGEMWPRETRAMIDSATLSIFIIPAIGLLFAVGLLVVSAIPDRRDLRRAKQSERKAGA